MAHDPSKTEKPTPKRINKARGEGNVPRSQEVGKTVTILAGYLALLMWIGYIGRNITGIFRHTFTKFNEFEPTLSNVYSLGLWLMQQLAKMLMPVLLIIMVAVYIVTRLQVGKLWTTKVFTPKLSKFNPISGLKRMLVSSETLMRLGKSLLQAIVIGIAPVMVLRAEMKKFSSLYYTDAAGVASYILSVSSKMITYALVPMVVIAAVHLIYTRWKYIENLKMTKDEIKDERKQQEGDPLVKNKIRQKMMAMSVRRMIKQVPTADVVITNPTHFAVALRYNPAEAPAPIVVAKGANHVAQKIKEIAKEHNIPIREDKILARALYKQTEPGDVIPAEMFQAVAVILAQVWKTRSPKQTLVRTER